MQTRRTRSKKAGNADKPSKNVFKEAVEAAIRCVEKAILSEVLHRHGGNRRKVSRELGMSYRSLLYKIAEYDIDIPAPKYSPKTKRRAKPHRPPKIDVSKLLPSPTERSMLVEDFERGNMDLDALADDYGLSVEAVRQIIEAESNPTSSSTEVDLH